MPSKNMGFDMSQKKKKITMTNNDKHNTRFTEKEMK